MDKEYVSCPFIEGGLVFNINKLQFCCIPHHGRGCVSICDFDKGDIPIDRILTLREEIRSQNQKDGYPLCKGCGHLDNRIWGNKEYMFDELILTHFTKCNLSCNYCYTVTDGIDYPKETYDVYPLVKQLIQNNQLSPESNIFWGGGEPTLLENFDQTLELLIQYGSRSHKINTNATKFSHSIKEGLANRQLEIVCSIDAGTRETYKQIKGRNLFDAVWKNLKTYADTGGDVTAKMIVTKDNAHDVVRFVDMVEKNNIQSVQYDLNQYETEYSDALIDKVSLLVSECMKRDIHASESNAIAMLGDSIRSRIQKQVEKHQLNHNKIPGTVIFLNKIKSVYNRFKRNA